MKSKEASLITKQHGLDPEQPGWNMPPSLLISFALLGSLALRVAMFDFESDDYRRYLSPWYDFIVEHKRWAALQTKFSNYPPLYLELMTCLTYFSIPKLYALKLLSAVFDYIAAIFIFKIVQQKHPEGFLPAIAAIVSLFLPTVLLNGALWGQCDAMYSSALVATVYWGIVNKPTSAMVAFGIACSFKPQSIFLVPFLAGLSFRKLIPIHFWLIPICVYFITALPAIFAGKPFIDVVLHYQWMSTTNTGTLTANAPNWYQWVSNKHYEILHFVGVLLALIAGIYLAFIMQLRSRKRDRVSWSLSFAAGSVILMPFLLPGMHERYFFPADLLSLTLAFVLRRMWCVAVMVQLCSFFVYVPYLFGKQPIPQPILALIMTAALAIVITDTIKTLQRSVTTETVTAI